MVDLISGFLLHDIRPERSACQRGRPEAWLLCPKVHLIGGLRGLTRRAEQSVDAVGPGCKSSWNRPFARSGKALAEDGSVLLDAARDSCPWLRRPSLRGMTG